MTATRLSASTAAALAGRAAMPGFTPQQVGIGHLHLGVGAFMRAHVAVYSDAAIAEDGGDWGIAGVSLRSSRVRDRLAPQDCLYTIATMRGADVAYRLIGSVREMHVAPEDPERVIALIADSRISVITLTVTEKGYCLEPDSGRLDILSPPIAADIADPTRPTSTPGFLVAGLARRRERAAGPVSIVSCDNLPGNGGKLEAAVAMFADAAIPGLSAWIDSSVSFPATMVDRIVPATTPDDILAAERDLDIRDEALVKAEPFSQWVIEDRFAAARPRWEAGGAQLVGDVAPYEKAKHRLLNGPHSALAYVGFLAGFRYVHEAMRDPSVVAYLKALMEDEIAPVSPEPEGMAHREYIDSVLERFANPALGHKTSQIAMDGSQKLPQRLLGSLRDQLQGDGPIAGLCLAIAAWMRYCLGEDEQGRPIDVADPMADRISGLTAELPRRADAIVGAFLSLGEVFGQDLPQSRRFRRCVERRLDRILDAGMLESVRARDSWDNRPI